MIELPNESAKIQRMRELYQEMEPDCFYKNHYELAKLTHSQGITAADWKEFLTIPSVSEYVEQELTMLIRAEQRALFKDISKNSRSVGLAQMINALQKTVDGNATKTGPIFIYTYVPVNEQEQHAENVRKLDTDPFRVRNE